MRYFIEFAYDGTNYHGWQIQPNGVTVQECLQKSLGTLLHCGEVDVVGAGRTDAGVHARFMVAHFNVSDEVQCQHLTYKLNKLLPPDISVYRIYRVDDDMHARFSAKSRTYHYLVHTQKNPFLKGRSCYLYRPTDFNLMNEAARILFEYDDFTSFSKTGTQTATNICHITEAHWTPIDGCRLDADGRPTEWCFTITANRFLRNMVRAIVGTLLQVGSGQITIDHMRHIIEARDRCTAGDSVTGSGLYLTHVQY